MAGGIGPLSNLPGKVTASNELVVAVTGAGSGGTSSVDEAAFTAGASAGTPAMGVYEATPSTLTDGQLGIVALDADRNLKVNIAAGGGSGGTSSAFGAAFPSDGTAVGIADPGGTMKALALDTLDYDTGAGTKAQSIIGIALPGSGGAVAGGTSTNPVRVDPTGSTTQPVSAASLPLPTGAATEATLATLNGKVTACNTGAVTISAALPAGTNNIGDVDVLSVVPGTGATNLGKAEDAAHTTGDTGVAAWGVANEAQSTFAADGDYIPHATDTKGNTMVVGNVAHDGADAGNPVKMGAKAVNAEPSAVANNDRVNLIADLVGKLIVLPYSNPENFVSGAITSAMTGTASTSCVAAPASGLRNYITTIIVSNASTTVPTDILIQDGNAGATLLVVPAPIGTGTGTGTSGATITLPTPLRQPTTATALYVQNVTTGSSTKVSMVGYKGA